MAKQQNERDTTLDSWSHNPPDRAAHKRGEHKANKTKNNCGKFSKLNYLFFLKTFPVFITSQAVYNVQTKILFLSRVLVSSCAKTSHLAHERSEERSLTNTINKSEPEVIQLFAISMQTPRRSLTVKWGEICDLPSSSIDFLVTFLSLSLVIKTTESGGQMNGTLGWTRNEKTISVMMLFLCAAISLALDSTAPPHDTMIDFSCWAVTRIKCTRWWTFSSVTLSVYTNNLT